jgi:hypothetical protein
MNALRAVNRLTFLLLLVIATLGYGVFSLWQAQINAVVQSESGMETSKVKRNRTALPGLPTYLPPPMTAFNEIMERPLFEESRTKPEAPVQEKTVAPRTPLNLRLEGVAAVAERSVALVRDLTTKELYRLTVGMEYQGWIVGRIDHDVAEFKRGDEIRELVLEVEEKTNPRAQMATQRMRAARNARRSSH